MHNGRMTNAGRWGRPLIVLAAAGLLAAGCSSGAGSATDAETPGAGAVSSGLVVDGQAGAPAGAAAQSASPGVEGAEAAGSDAAADSGAGRAAAGADGSASGGTSGGGSSSGGIGGSGGGVVVPPGGGAATIPPGGGNPAATAPPQPGAPSAPGKPKVRVEGNVLSASWAAPSGAVPVTEYRAFAFDAEDLPSAQCNAVAPKTDCAFDALPPGKYTVKVRAVSGNLAGSVSQASDAVEVRR